MSSTPAPDSQLRVTKRGLNRVAIRQLTIVTITPKALTTERNSQVKVAQPQISTLAHTEAHLTLSVVVFTQWNGQAMSSESGISLKPASQLISRQESLIHRNGDCQLLPRLKERVTSTVISRTTRWFSILHFVVTGLVRTISGSKPLATIQLCTQLVPNTSRRTRQSTLMHTG
jgi:hypothetical protein